MISRVEIFVYVIKFLQSIINQGKDISSNREKEKEIFVTEIILEKRTIYDYFLVSFIPFDNSVGKNDRRFWSVDA